MEKAKTYWDSLSIKQKDHFLKDHKSEIKRSSWLSWLGKDFDSLPDNAKKVISKHVEEGLYKSGGSFTEFLEKAKKSAVKAGKSVKQSAESFSKTAKSKYSETKKAVNEKVKDQKRKIALDVLDETKDKVKDNKYKLTLKGAQEIIEDKYAKGGEVEEFRKGGKITKKQAEQNFIDEYLKENLYQYSPSPSIKLKNYHIKMAKRVYNKKMLEQTPERYYDVTFRTPFGATPTYRLLGKSGYDAFVKNGYNGLDIQGNRNKYISGTLSKNQKDEYAKGGGVGKMFEWHYDEIKNLYDEYTNENELSHETAVKKIANKLKLSEKNVKAVVEGDYIPDDEYATGGVFTTGTKINFYDKYYDKNREGTIVEQLNPNEYEVATSIGTKLVDKKDILNEVAEPEKKRWWQFAVGGYIDIYTDDLKQILLSKYNDETAIDNFIRNSRFVDIGIEYDWAPKKVASYFNPSEWSNKMAKGSNIDKENYDLNYLFSELSKIYTNRDSETYKELRAIKFKANKEVDFWDLVWAIGTDLQEKTQNKFQVKEKDGFYTWANRLAEHVCEELADMLLKKEGISLEKQSEDTLSRKEILEETLSAIGYMLENVNSWAIRNTAAKLSHFDFYNEAIAVADEDTAYDILSEARDYVRRNSANEYIVDEIYDLVGQYSQVRYAKGGHFENENREMVLNNNKQIAHHTKELEEAVKDKHVPAWVVAKVNRSASDLSDATHYMEGHSEQYAKGGLLDSRNEHEGYNYQIWYLAPRGYYVKGADIFTKKLFAGDNSYFEKSDEAKEYAEITIYMYLSDTINEPPQYAKGSNIERKYRIYYNKKWQDIVVSAKNKDEAFELSKPKLEKIYNEKITKSKWAYSNDYFEGVTDKYAKGANIKIGDRVRFKKNSDGYGQRLYDGSFRVKEKGKQASGFNGGYLLSNRDFEVGARKSEIEKYATGTNVSSNWTDMLSPDEIEFACSVMNRIVKPGAYIDNENLKHSNKSELAKAINSNMSIFSDEGKKLALSLISKLN